MMFVALVALTNTNANNCIDKNPFLVAMRDAKPLSVNIFSNVKTGSFQQCRNEWNTYGNCCDVSELNEFIKLENKLIDSNVETLRSTVFKLSVLVQKHINKLGGKDMSEYSINHANAFTNFDASSNRCWSYMKHIRGNSLCTTCSGRSEEFFKGDKILISSETCRKAVTSCDDFFTKLSQINKMIPLIKVSIIASNYSENTVTKLLKIADEIKTYSPPLELVHEFEAHEHMKSEDARNHVDTNICAMIVSVRKSPYIVVMNHQNIEAVAEKQMDQAKKRHSTNIQEIEKMNKESLKSIHVQSSLEKKVHKEFVKQRSQSSIQAYNRNLDKINKQIKKAIDLIKSKSLKYVQNLDNTKNQLNTEKLNLKNEYNRRISEIKARRNNKQLEIKTDAAIIINQLQAKLDREIKKILLKPRKNPKQNAFNQNLIRKVESEIISKRNKVNQNMNVLLNKESNNFNSVVKKEQRGYQSQDINLVRKYDGQLKTLTKQAHEARRISDQKVQELERRKLEIITKENHILAMSKVQDQAILASRVSIAEKQRIDNLHKVLSASNLIKSKAEEALRLSLTCIAKEKENNQMKWNEETTQKSKLREDQVKMLLQSNFKDDTVSSRSLTSNNLEVLANTNRVSAFTGDSAVVIPNKNNLYESFAGATGTSEEGNKHFLRPMNMSLTFP